MLQNTELYPIMFPWQILGYGGEESAIHLHVGQEILDIIKQRISDVNYCSIMFDETTDLSHTSQMRLTIKFIDMQASISDSCQKPNSEEDPLEIKAELHQVIDPMFEEIVLSGKSLGQVVLKANNDLSLQIEKCVAIGINSCSVLVSQSKSLVKKFKLK